MCSLHTVLRMGFGVALVSSALADSSPVRRFVSVDKIDGERIVVFDRDDARVRRCNDVKFAKDFSELTLVLSASENRANAFPGAVIARTSSELSLEISRDGEHETTSLTWDEKSSEVDVLLQRAARGGRKACADAIRFRMKRKT